MENKDKPKAYCRALEFKQEILDSRKVTLERGFEIGFHSAKDYLNLKKKFTSYCYAFPFSGKTSAIFDFYMYIAKTYKIVIAIYSPESGGRNSLVSYLVQVYLGKKLHGKNKQEATDAEWEEALAFIDKHFILLVPKTVGKDKINFDTREVFSQIYNAEKEYGVKVELLLLDPYNQLSKSAEDRKKNLADYTLENLSYINQVAEQMDMHIQIAMHLREEETIIDKETGIEYTGKPHASKVANGQSSWRVGQTLFGLHRLPAGVTEKLTGIPYPENGTDFLIQKNKVFGAGEVGSFRLFYNVDKQKFYEIIDGKKYYCGEYEEYLKTKETTPSKMKPSNLFG